MSVLRNKINKLLIRFKSGDNYAIKELFDFLFKKLVVIAGSLLINKTLAEDAVSQTFLQVCKSINNFDDEKDGYNWILKILGNKVKDINREYQVECELTETSSVGDVFDSVNNKADVYIALRKLSTNEQEIIMMRFFEDKTYSEIGEELGISSQMAYKKVDAILKKLKEIFKNG